MSPCPSVHLLFYILTSSLQADPITLAHVPLSSSPVLFSITSCFPEASEPNFVWQQPQKDDQGPHCLTMQNNKQCLL